MSRKAGLDSAIDFTKFVITLDSALIAFITGAAFLDRATSVPEKSLGGIALFLLVASITAGAVALMRAATMLADGLYSLEDPHLRWPGLINVTAFALAAAMVSGLGFYVLVIKPPSSKPPVPVVKIVLDRAR